MGDPWKSYWRLELERNTCTSRIWSTSFHIPLHGLYIRRNKEEAIIKEIQLLDAVEAS
jgi:hypothetical protein